MDHDTRFERALGSLASALRREPGVLMVADDSDDDGAPRILVVLKVGAERPARVPDEVDGFPVVVERTRDIVAHDGRPKG
jgi:hypothetical protein